MSAYVPKLTPAQVLDVQADLMTRANGGAHTMFGRMIKNLLYERVQGGVIEDGDDESTGRFMSTLARSCLVGEAFYCTRDLADEAERRADDEEYMPGTRSFDRHDAPTEAGVAYIEGGLHSKELWGRDEKAHLVVWGPGQATFAVQEEGSDGVLRARGIQTMPVTMIWGFNDLKDADDVMATMPDGDDAIAAMLAGSGRWAFVSCMIMPQDERIGPARVYAPQSRIEKAIRENAYPELVMPEEPFSHNAIRRVIALWDLLNESVNVVTHGNANLDRPTVRRARRANLPGRVTVVKLRRAKYVDREYIGHTAVDWSHRWIVRRHKRWQACGPGRTERKLIWIESHVKGPENAPVMQSKKVYRLDR